MDRYNALKIARIAYRDIRRVIDMWSSENDFAFVISTHWDRYISVNEHNFTEIELMGSEQDVE